MDLLVELLFLWAAVWLARRLLTPRRPPTIRRPATVRKRVRAAGDMVACSHCGLYIPRSEALTGPQETAFCSAEHKIAATARR